MLRIEKNQIMIRLNKIYQNSKEKELCQQEYEVIQK